MAQSWFGKHKTAVGVCVVIVVVFFLFQVGLIGRTGSMGALGETKSSSIRSSEFGVPQMMRAPSPMASAPGGFSSEDRMVAPEDHRIERSARADFETGLFDAGRRSLEAIPAQYKGYYTSKGERKERYGEAEYRVFEITMKVPSGSFEDAVADLKRIDGLKQLSVDASDRTQEYADAKAYYDNYVAERGRLMDLYNKTGQVEDLVKVEQALGDLQVKIDRYAAQLKNIERVTEFATISAVLTEKHEIVESYYEMTPLSVLKKNMLESVDSVAVVISSLSAWIILAFVIWLGYRGYRRFSGAKPSQHRSK